ncbi:MAG: substrate-binding domain-containing protein [Spirochaetaceae bacterium]|nr:substrate-binding domain-containing protein [Spirochaetaceae bacterium]
MDDGYRRIGFVGGDLEQMTCYERYLGYCRALQEANIPLEDEFVSFSGVAMHDGYFSMKEMLDKPNYPDAFFFVNLMICLGATQLVVEKPQEIQDRLVCASFDDAFFSSLLHRCRYFVSQPVEEIGVLAAHLVLQRLNKKDGLETVKTIRLNTELIQITHKEV